MVEHSREIDQAIASLTAEILKLVPENEGAHAALRVTIENAFSRLSLAILAQANQASEAGKPLPAPEMSDAITAGRI